MYFVHIHSLLLFLTPPTSTILFTLYRLHDFFAFYNHLVQFVVVFLFWNRISLRSPCWPSNSRCSCFSFPLKQPWLQMCIATPSCQVTSPQTWAKLSNTYWGLGCRLASHIQAAEYFSMLNFYPLSPTYTFSKTSNKESSIRARVCSSNATVQTRHWTTCNVN